MIERLAAAVFIIAIAVCAIYASHRWNEDKHPLLISSGCAAGPNPCAKTDCYKQDTRKWA